MGTILFLIVTHNSEGEIELCLNSIVAQGLQSYRVVVVDNASTDGTTARIEASGVEVTLLRNEQNLGFAAACNQAASDSEDEFIMLLNPDAALCPGAVEQMLTEIESDQRVGIVGPRLRSRDGRLLPSAYRLPTVFQELAYLWGLRRALVCRPFKSLFGRLLAGRFGQFDPHDTKRVVDTVLGACMLVRRSVWEQLGGMDERFFLFYEEKDFCKRASDAGFAAVFVPTAEAVHEIGASVKSDPLAAAIAKRVSMRRYYRKHKGTAANLVVGTALLLNALWRVAEVLLKLPIGGQSRAELRMQLRAWRSLIREI